MVKRLYHSAHQGSGSNLAALAGGGNFVNGERLNSSADTNNIQNFINSNK